MRLLRKAELSWEMAPTGGVRGAGTGSRGAGACDKPKWLFATDAQVGLVAGAGGDCNADVGGGALKIWNNTRIEMEPGTAPAAAVESADDALSSQIITFSV